MIKSSAFSWADVPTLQEIQEFVVQESKPATRVESPASLYQRGVAFKEASVYNQAVTFFEQAGRESEFYVKARIQIALCLRATGRMADAAPLLQYIWVVRRVRRTSGGR